MLPVCEEDIAKDPVIDVGPITLNEPVIIADPVYGNPPPPAFKAYDAVVAKLELTAFKTYDAV
jgi:hypothetical protein